MIIFPVYCCIAYNFCKNQQLDDPILGLSRGYLLNGLSDKVVQAYYDYMVDLAIMLGANRARAKEELLDVLEFETSLANVSNE